MRPKGIWALGRHRHCNKGAHSPQNAQGTCTYMQCVLPPVCTHNPQSWGIHSIYTAPKYIHKL